MGSEIKLVIRVDSSGSQEFQQFGKTAKTGMDTAGKSQEDFARRSEAAGRRVGLALAAAGAAIVALGVSSIRAAAEFDTSMREVNTLLNLPLERFEELKQAVINLDPALGSTTDLVGGLYQTISAGIGSPNDLGTSLEFIEIAATAAKAGLADVDTAVLAGSKTLKGFNLEATEATRVFDVMFKTVKQGQTNFQELASVAGDLATTAGVLNITVEESFGALAELSLSAGSTAQAATQLDGVMRALIKPTATMQAAIEGLGFANGETLIESQGLEQALRSIVGTTDGTTVAVGKLFSRAEGLRGVLSLMQNDFGALNSQIEGMADASGAAGEAFAEIQKSAGEQFEVLRNRMERLVIVIGDKLLPFALKLVDGIEILVDAFMSLGDTGQTVVVALGAIGGVLALAGGAFLALAGPIGSAIGLLTGGGGIAAATVGASGGFLRLGSSLTSFVRVSKLGRNELGQFTTAMTGFQRFFSGPGSIAASAGALKTGVATLASSIGTKLVGAVTSAGSAFSGLWAIILANPIAAIAIAVGIVAVAVSSFVFKEGGMFENWIAGTKDSIKDLAGGITDFGAEMDRLRPSIDLVNQVADKFRTTMPAITAAIAEQTNAGTAYDEILGKLAEQFAVGTAEGDALRAGMIEVGAALNEAGRAATETERVLRELEQAELDAAESAKVLAAAQKEAQEALESLGIKTAKDAAAQIETLSLAFGTGEVPLLKMAELLDKTRTELAALGILTPELEQRLFSLAGTYDTLNVSQTSALASMSELGRQFALTAGEFKDNMPVIAEWPDVTLPKMVPALDRAKLGMQQFGITIPDIARDMANLTAVVESQEAPVRQVVEAIRSQRDEYEKLGVLTPDVVKELNLLERAALENATAADRAALGFKGLFDGLETGIPAIDNFLGKFGGIFDSITGVLGGLGGKVGGFFSNLTSQIGGLFGAGGKQGGDNFFSSLVGGLGGIGSLFGGKGDEAAQDFTTNITAGVGAVVPMFTTLGGGSAKGFATEIGATLGGGGGFDIGGMFNTSGQAATQGFTLGLSTVPGETGSIFAEAANQSGGGFLSGLAGIFGGGGEGGGFLSSLFSGAGGGAGGNFLSGLMGGLSSGMGAAQSGIQGIFQAGLSLIPVVGPILAQFAGPLFKGIKAIGGKIIGIFKGLFGGPSAAEVAGRKTAAEFNAVLAAMLDTAAKAEVAAAVAAGGTEQWATKVVAIKSAYLAMGKTEAEALAVSDALWRAQKEGPEAVQAVIAGIQPELDAVQAAMASTGLSLTELRDLATQKSIEMGISVREAFDIIAAGTVELIETATIATANGMTKMEGSLDRVAARIEERVGAAGLSAEMAAERIQISMDRATARIEERFTESGGIISSSMAMGADTAVTDLTRIETKAIATSDTISSAMSTGLRTVEMVSSQVADGQIAATQRAADTIVVTEAQKNEAIRTLASTMLSGVKNGLTERQQAENMAAQETIRVWEIAHGEVGRTAELLGGKIGGVFSGITAAVESSSIAQTLAVETSSMAQTLAVESSSMAQILAVESSTMAHQAAWEQSTSAVQAAVIDSTQVITQAIADGSTDNTAAVKQFATEAIVTFEDFKLGAIEASDTVSSSFAVGIGAAALELNSLASEAGSAFDFIEQQAGDAARGAVDRFSEMRRELTGKSVFPDMAAEASEDLRGIGDVGEQEAQRLSKTFARDFADATGKKLAEIKARFTSSEVRGGDRARLDSELDGLEVRQARAPREIGRGTGDGFQARPDSEGDRRRGRRALRRGMGEGFEVRPRADEALFRGVRSDVPGNMTIGAITINGVADPKKTADILLKEIGRRAALKGIRVSAVN